MTDESPQALTTQVLIQIRDEIREMRTSFEARFEESDDRFDRRFEGVDHRFKSLLDAISEMRTSFEERFEEIDRRFEQIDQRFEAIERRFEAIDQRFEAIERRMDKIESRLDVIEDALSSLVKSNAEQHKQLFQRFDQLDADLKRFAGIVNDTMLHYADEMDTVRARLDAIENKISSSPPVAG